MRIAAAFVALACVGLAGCATGSSAVPAATGGTPAPPSGEPPRLALPASFTGTLPCADCEGIDYRLDLFEDRSYFLRTTYRGRSPGEFDDVGSFDWSSDGRALIAQGGREAPLRFSIESADELRLLDLSGQPVDSKLNYSLRRASGLAPLEGTSWRLVSLGAAARYRAMGVHLELFDAAGAVLARFEAQPVAE